MNKGMRTRILILQAGLIGIFAFCSILLLAGGAFVQGMIHDQLVAQKIFFPAAGTAALSATEFPNLQKYGGQQVDSGPKAQGYSTYIGEHLTKVAGGLTYSEVSAQARANPTDVKIKGQVETLFKGETLKGLLLNAYGWWTVGTYATYAGFGMAVAAAAVLVAMLVEIALLVRARDVGKAKAKATRATLAHQS
jgi:hypothetical protein